MERTIFFEVEIIRENKKKPWGFEVDVGDRHNWTVANVYYGSAAHQAGLRVGDLLLGINGGVDTKQFGALLETDPVIVTGLEMRLGVVRTVW